MIDLKIYYVAENRGPQWFYSYGVLSNGFCFGQHICSHPDFAPGDLLLNRSDRKEALKKIFDIEPTEDNQELFVVNTKKDIPSWWMEQEKLQDSLKEKYEEYTKLLDTK